MDRDVLTDVQWAKIEPHCLGKPRDPGRSGKDNRLFLEAVLWIVRTGSPWRDLPERYGPWQTVYKRFREWSESGLIERIFHELGEDADLQDISIDSTYIKAHKSSAGAERGGSLG